ncbi:MAG: D-alanine--D-alanine ligase [Opitutales bacterium]|nr:D-alanine--D-alanine ligase [Opitutales bacterium]
MSKKNIVVLCGAISPERDVSINSGKSCLEALRVNFPDATLRVLDENAVPADLDPATDVIFPVIHGDYGEDGGIQRDLEARGFSYAGCGVAASELCIDKSKTKALWLANGIPTTRGVAFPRDRVPAAKVLIESLGEEIVVKPADKGSSVGLFLTKGEAELQAVLDGDLSASDLWLAEQRVYGRELTVGLLNGKAMGIVEICPKVGVYDFKNKYTKGSTEYKFPAAIDEAIAAKIRAGAERIFELCGCRDFSRVDVLLPEDGNFVYLEVNTMPGLTGTSLLPKSASCVGLDFAALAKAMIVPALERAGV